jgi:excisionase family DNA binding protein
MVSRPAAGAVLFTATPASRRALSPVADLRRARIQVAFEDGQILELPTELADVLLAAVLRAADGHDLALLSRDDEVSPAKAGKLLGLSRQYVDRLIAEGLLPARRLPGSTHRKIRVSDVLAFADRRADRQQLITDMVDTLTDAGAEY